MTKFIILGLLSLSLFNVVAYANPIIPEPSKPSRTPEPAKPNHKEEMGLGLGALIGGLIAGPPGAIIGAAGGAFFGNKEKQKDTKTAGLEQRLVEKQSELAYLQDQFSDLQMQYGKELQKVKLQDHTSALDKLSRGMALTVYFRTNSTAVDRDVAANIQRLANFLKDFPEIQLHLDAHADKRGSDYYNQNLSRRRAQAVRQTLVEAGIDGKRIHSHAYGESKATAKDGDVEGYIFDRRVNIVLTLDSQA